VSLSATDVHDAPPLCWLHGFTQTGQSAHVFRSILAAHRTVVTPDLLGHGARGTERGSLEEIADDIADSFPATPVDVGGYSFGARVALHVALRHPDKVRRLVLLGATRGIVDVNARAARRARDEELATHIEEDGVEQFIDEWLAGPMFRSLPRDDVERAIRVGQTASGLANSLRDAGTGTQRWLGDDLNSIDSPTLCLAGAADDRFAREAFAIAATVPHGVAQLVPGAGHAAHLHQPAWVAALVESFLRGSVHERAGRYEDDSE
jgi:2-succinyl-6-hydroxy-2,4-cyclohexadiene-1-carboxylate synthase